MSKIEKERKNDTADISDKGNLQKELESNLKTCARISSQLRS